MYQESWSHCGLHNTWLISDRGQQEGSLASRSGLQTTFSGWLPLWCSLVSPSPLLPSPTPAVLCGSSLHGSSTHPRHEQIFSLLDIFQMSAIRSRLWTVHTQQSSADLSDLWAMVEELQKKLLASGKSWQQCCRVNSAWHVGPKYYWVEILWLQRTLHKHDSHHVHIKPFSDPLWPMDGGIQICHSVNHITLCSCLHRVILMRMYLHRRYIKVRYVSS